MAKRLSLRTETPCDSSKGEEETRTSEGLFDSILKSGKSSVKRTVVNTAVKTATSGMGKGVAKSVAQGALKGLLKENGRIDFEDNLIVVITDKGQIIFQGSYDDYEMKSEPWKYNDKKGIYELEYQKRKYFMAKVDTDKIAKTMMSLKEG
jgi:hypothetical protein